MSQHNSPAIRWLLFSTLLCALGALWFSHNAIAQAPTETPPPVRQLARDEDFEALQAAQLITAAAPAGTTTIASLADAEIIEGYPTSGCSDVMMMHVGYDDFMQPNGNITRGLLKFNLSAIPSGAVINNVQLQAYLVASWDYPGHSRIITTYRIASAWLEDRVTWNSAPALAEAYGSTAVTHGNWSWYSFDVTSLVNGWRGGQFPNDGIALRGPEYSGSDSSWKAFATGATIYPPRLVVNYSSAGASGSRVIVIPDQSTTLSAADYVLTATPTSQSVNKGGAVNYTLTVSPTSGFSGTVAFAVSDLPASVSSGWSSNPIVVPNDTQRIYSTLTLSTTASTPPGSYPLTVTSTSANLSHQVPVTLTVQSPNVYLPLVVKQKPPVPYNILFLIIGISDYEYMDPPPAPNARAGSPGYDLIQPLRDSSNTFDTLSMRGCSSVVTQSESPETAGCPSSNFLVLNDSQATKTAIRNAIVGWLNERANTDTTVVIFYSGHGSSDGYHEYIAPYDLACNPCGPTPDTTTWDLTTAIRDDELAGWLNQLSSQRVVLFFDSCFSGGMATAANDMARGLIDRRDSQAGGQLLARVTAPGRVALMASAANQSSWEFSTLKNGAFTYYLVEALLSPGADTNQNGQVSAEEAFAYLAGPVDNYVFTHTGEHQNPQISDGIAGEVDLTFPMAAPAICPAW